MTRLVKKRTSGVWWRGILFTALAFAVATSVSAYGYSDAARGNRERELALVEKAVNRAVVSCYAIEGFYPPSIDYLIENYGLKVDLDKYYIHHEAVASNVYPTVWVAGRGDGSS